MISLAIFYRKSITALASLFHHNTWNAHCSYHIYSHNSNLYLDVLCACVQKALRNVKYSPLSLYSICHFGQVVMDLTSVRDLKTPSTIYDGYCMDGNRSPPPYREVPFFFGKFTHTPSACIVRSLHETSIELNATLNKIARRCE